YRQGHAMPGRNKNSHSIIIQNHCIMSIEFQRGLRVTTLVVLGVIIFLNLVVGLSYQGSAVNFGWVLFSAIMVVFVIVLWKIKAEPVQAAPRDEREPGDACWSSSEEFDKANDPDKESNRAYWIGGRYFRSKFAHCVVIGGAGCGKTTSRLIPALLLKPFGS